MTSPEVANKLRSKSEELILEFYDVKSGRQISKSSIVSQYFVREFLSDDKKIELHVDLVKDSWVLSDNNAFYKEIAKHILRFSYIERTLTETHKTAKLVRFYEEVRKLGIMNQNPQFWLQYAMARMSFNDYELAGQYFHTSYGISDNWDWYNSKFIDTQYARFLLERNIYLEQSAYSPLDDLYSFIEIISKLTGEDSSEHYPYRTAARLWDFVQKFNCDLDENARTAILTFLELLSQRISTLPLKLRNHRYVRNCNASFHSIKRLFQQQP